MTSAYPSLTSMEEKLRAATRMPQPRPEFLAGLRARLAAEPPRPVTPGEHFRRMLRRPAWAVSMIALLLIAAAFLAIGPQRVFAAVRGLFGYIPGVGIVDQSSPIRVLAEPASLTRDGVSITVTSAVLTGDRTHIDYRIFGVPRSAYPDREDVHGCWSQPYLRLADGTQLAQVNNGYGPVPAGVNEAVFVVPCIANTLPGKAPENWELPLRFVAAPPDLTIVPVVEILPSETPTAAAGTPTPGINPLVITKVLDIGDKFVLMGEFNYQDAYGAALPAGSWWAVQQIFITGADGREVPQSFSNDFQPPQPTRPESETWLYQLDKSFVPPLTITYTGQVISPSGPEEQAEFEFDAGSHPEDGGVWTVNKDLNLGGYNIRLVSVEASATRGYSFHFKADPGASANLICVDIAGYTPNCGGGGGGNEFPEEFDRSVCYAGMPGGPEFPRGLLKIVVRFQALVREDSSFQVQWSPDPAQTGAFMTSTPQPGVCLNLALLEQLDAAPPALPGGKALVYEDLNGAGQWGLALYDLDDPQPRFTFPGRSWGALSPDGGQVAYPAEDGIHIVDLAAGTERVLNGVTGFDLHWSPDGKQIAYIGSAGADGAINSVFIVNSDGTQAHQVSTWSYEYVTGWSPDGAQLYFVAPFTGGAAWKVYALDIASGETQERFTIENGSAKFLNPKLSPDGSWIAYRGRDNSSLYLVRTDGSEMQLVVDNAGAVGVEWSRGGWLGISLRKANSDESSAVLVKPDGCEAYRLPAALHGDLQGLFIP